MADLVFPGKAPNATVLNSGNMPINMDMVIYKGDFVEVFVTVKDDNDVALDLTGYTAAASLKSDFADSAPTDFTCTVTGITGEVRIYLSSTLSSALVAGDYIWDFEIINEDGDARTYITGDVTVYNEVTTA